MVADGVLPFAQGGPSFRSLEISARLIQSPSALEEAARRATPGSPGVVILSDGTVASDVFSAIWRVWWGPPDHWRDDFERQGGATDVSIVRGDASLVYVAAIRTLLTTAPSPVELRTMKIGPRPAGTVEMPSIQSRLDTFPLIRPRLPASEWELTPMGLTSRAGTIGRPVRQIRAVRRRGAIGTDTGQPSGVWIGIDEYHLDVDDTVPILTRLVGVFNDAVASELIAEVVRIDGEIPSSTYEFNAPKGSHIVKI